MKNLDGKFDAEKLETTKMCEEFQNQMNTQELEQNKLRDNLSKVE